DQLYQILKGSNEEESILTIRTLHTHNISSHIKKKITLGVRTVFFGELCQNGRQLILFSKNDSGMFPIFIDLNDDSVTYSTHTFSPTAKWVISSSGELWTWDPQTKEIWSVSSTEATLRGTMNGNEEVSLVYVDSSGHLYVKEG